MNEQVSTFWEHLDVLRWTIIRSLLVVVAFAVVAFCFKDELFSIILAPASGSFITFRLMDAPDFSIHLINTGITEQFMNHMRIAAYTGLLCASPYVLYQLFRFVSPGLYDNERRASVKVVSAAYAMFLIGTLVCYFIIFPLTVRFLGTYQVSADVENMLTLQSYVDTLISMCLVMGIIFELPVVSALLGRMHLLSGTLMRRYRRHAIVTILIVAAIITPTGDIFTLLVVSIPIWLLYELSIWLVPNNR